MRLIKLLLTPNGNENGAVVEIAIDPLPGMFTSRYVHVMRMMDGSHEIVDHPPHLDEDLLKKAYTEAVVIIDMVYDMTSAW